MSLALLIADKPHAGHEGEFWPQWTAFMEKDGLRPKGGLSQANVDAHEVQPNLASDDEHEAFEAQIAPISSSLYDASARVLKIGLHKFATDWARSVFGDAKAAELAGADMVEVLRTTEGAPRNTLDGIGFNGDALGRCTSILPDTLAKLRWIAQTPDEFAAWGKALSETAEQSAAKHAMAIEILTYAQEDNVIGLQILTAHDCGRWAQWWADYGYGMEPSF